ncbi:MAG TPA: hypothetical protein VEI02_03450, partial [Planctomycetota bacterium]|nr:hypothetical protein [Planctomycetota bacterium]
PPPRDRREGDGREGRRPPPRRERLWAKVIEEMTPAERRAFVALPEAEKERLVRAAIARRAAAEEEAFLKTLSETDRAAVDALAGRPNERRLKIAELRIDRVFERAAEEARARGVAEEAEIERLRSGAAPAKASAALDLQRRNFVAAHREELERLPPRERERIDRLAPEEFFDDPFVQDFRTFRFLSPVEVARVRALQAEVVRALIAGLAEGRVDDVAAARAFSAERLAALRTLGVEDLRRLGGALRRLSVDDGPGEGGRGARGGGWHLPPVLFEELTHAEREEFGRLRDVERRRFAVRRFGPARVAATRLETLRRRLGAGVRAAFDALPEDEQARLADLPGAELRRELERRFQLPSEREGEHDRGRRPPADRRDR